MMWWIALWLGVSTVLSVFIGTVIRRMGEDE
jgi:hypothetical protein